MLSSRVDVCCDFAAFSYSPTYRCGERYVAKDRCCERTAFPHVRETHAERCASGAGSSRSDAGAKAVPRRLQAVVRLGGPRKLWVGRPRSSPLPRPCAFLFDHLIRQDEERWGERDPERLRRLAVEDQLELHGLFHGQVGRFGAFEKAIHIVTDGV